jgi:cell division protein FtsL
MEKGGMNLSGTSKAALAVAALLVALSLVTWRQARAREALVELDQIRREISLVQADNGELDRRIQHLESRGRVVPAARDRLGMVLPASGEMVLLTGDAR